jgi:hypothetical protein
MAWSARHGGAGLANQRIQRQDRTGRELTAAEEEWHQAADALREVTWRRTHTRPDADCMTRERSVSDEGSKEIPTRAARKYRRGGPSSARPPRTPKRCTGPPRAARGC